MILGFDIGGTKVLGVAIDHDGTVKRELRVPTPAGPEQLVATLLDVAPQLAPAPRAVGVGIAGLVGRDGRIRVSPHLFHAETLDLPGDLGRALGVPVTVDNDANAAAWGEARAGVGRGVDELVLVTLGTGIGSGILCHGQLVRGAHGFGGEAGHMVVDHHGPLHVTGLPGAWEQYGSGRALDALTRAAGLGSEGQDLAAGIAAGETRALAVLDEYAYEVAVGVANLVAILDCELVILGGGVSDLGEPLRAAVAGHLPGLLIGFDHRTQLRVVLATLGERAGAIGAALLAAEYASGASRSDPAN
jgi:glucokinase